MALKLIVKLWALATVRGLLPVIVPLNNDANGTQWGPVTADISANRCRAFAVAFDVARHEDVREDDMVRRVVDRRRGRRCEEREEREPPAAPARGPS